MGVAGWESAHAEEVAVAEVVGEGGESPANNLHIRRGEGQGEFVGRRVLFIR